VDCSGCLFVVFFLLGDAPETEFYMTTFRNAMCSETSAHKIQTQENYPKKEHNIHNTAKG
jgi:hypothetical protein